MRPLFFTLMIALLPLRGWMGDAMATEMAVMQISHGQSTERRSAGYQGSETTVEFTQVVHHEMPPAQGGHDCGDPAATASSDSGDAGESGNGHDVYCQFCDACHTLALSLAFEAYSQALSAVSLSLSRTEPFASAGAALAQKPPIS